ncbi:MAG TPA: hypothetical protein VJ521_03375, partial [Acidobacteriota bacterium]|nr:hypothetical protein [Acidobacteriota bacterium]
ALKFTIKIDQEALLRGETTTMHAWVEGTTEVLQIELTNKTPAIIELEGGVQQTAQTSGGYVNKIMRKVRGLARGQFNIGYRLIAPTCPCLEQTPDQGPADLPGESPTDESTTPIGEEVPPPPPETPCEVSDVKGAFEPAQGVWQDDPFFKQYNADKAGDRLKKESETSYRAELPMVHDRKTLLFGIGETDFNEIIIKGNTTGSEPIEVEVLFTLFERSTKLETIYRSPEKTTVYLRGRCGKKKEFTIRIPTPNGLPPGKAFNMTANDSYRIEAELVRAGTEIGTGIKVEVKGDVVQTNLPTIHFVPIILTKQSDSRLLQQLEQRLKSISDRLADESASFIDDYFPLRSKSVSVVKSETRELSGFLEKIDLPDLDKLRELSDDEIRDVLGDKVFQRLQAAKKLQLDVLDKAGLLLEKDVTIEMLRDSLTNSRKLAKEGLVVVILSDADFTGYMPDPDPSGPRGIALSEKVVVVRADEGRYVAGSDSVAHEIIHTQEYSWDDRDMPDECGVNYHNVAPRSSNGHRIENGTAEVSERKKNLASIMEPGEPWWINQCSYFHLLINLQKAVDPAVILIRGLVARDGSKSAGALFPSYQLEGEIDLLESKIGEWAIVLRDAIGGELRRYRFDPVWKLPDTVTARKIAGFSFRVKEEPNLSRIDLEGPSGLLTHRSISKTLPRILILAPQDR